MTTQENGQPPGSIPNQHIEVSNMSQTNVSLVGIDIDNMRVPASNAGTGDTLYSVPITLSDAPEPRWIDLFVANWDNPPGSTTMHRPGIASVAGRAVYLRGVTIEEVEQYHLRTLKLVIDKTNSERAAQIAAEQQQHDEREAARATRQQNAEEIAEHINQRIQSNG